MNKDLIIIGYSGHAYVAIDIALALSFNIIGYVDTNEKKLNPYNLKYLGTDEILLQNQYSDTELFIAIGDNHIRSKIFQKLKEKYPFASLFHHRSVQASLSKIGEGTMIASSAVINPLVDIGNACIINTGAIIEHECKVGHYTHVGPGAVLAGNVTIGESTFVGANSVTKQGVTIGSNVTIGAGAVVINDVPHNSVVVGNPARILK